MNTRRRTRGKVPWAKIGQLDSLLLMSLSSKNLPPSGPYFWQTRVKQTIVDYKGGWVNTRRRTRGKEPWAKIGQLVSILLMSLASKNFPLSGPYFWQTIVDYKEGWVNTRRGTRGRCLRQRSAS